MDASKIMIARKCDESRRIEAIDDCLATCTKKGRKGMNNARSRKCPESAKTAFSNDGFSVIQASSLKAVYSGHNHTENPSVNPFSVCSGANPAAFMVFPFTFLLPACIHDLQYPMSMHWLPKPC